MKTLFFIQCNMACVTEQMSSVCLSYDRLLTAINNCALPCSGGREAITRKHKIMTPNGLMFHDVL